ncbi:hypothetical protein GCM10023113_20120 [Cellulomonas oligotrophica]|uniref:IclR-ED domain-containing protein n=1 Tax=Cellulomonas oligotrophica TaxID=931536 RepID=A0ABQ4DFL6_9CELL|nr:hypothetical protein Col01nite_36660 [Cellulomonas oligotrophica]
MCELAPQSTPLCLLSFDSALAQSHHSVAAGLPVGIKPLGVVSRSGVILPLSRRECQGLMLGIGATRLNEIESGAVQEIQEK